MAVREYALLRANRIRAVKRLIARFPRTFLSDPSYRRYREQILRRVGETALSIIQQAFLIRARHGVDAAGYWWKPLAPSTIAKRRAGRGRGVRGRRGKRIGRRRARLIQFDLDKFEILRDTGRLYRSLTVGTRSPDQVFDLTDHSVTVGTNVDYAEYHHRGVYTYRKNLPKRRLWPEFNTWPAHWQQQLMDQIEQGIAAALMDYLKRMKNKDMQYLSRTR